MNPLGRQCAWNSCMFRCIPLPCLPDERSVRKPHVASIILEPSYLTIICIAWKPRLNTKLVNSFPSANCGSVPARKYVYSKCSRGHVSWRQKDLLTSRCWHLWTIPNVRASCKVFSHFSGRSQFLHRRGAPCVVPNHTVLTQLNIYTDS